MNHVLDFHGVGPLKVSSLNVEKPETKVNDALLFEAGFVPRASLTGRGVEHTIRDIHLRCNEFWSATTI